MDLSKIVLATLPAELLSKIQELAKSDEMTPLARRFGQTWYDSSIQIYLATYYGGFVEAGWKQWASKPDPTAADMLSLFERENRKIEAEYARVLGTDEHIIVGWGDSKSQRFVTNKRLLYHTKNIAGSKVTSVDFAEGESLVEVLRDSWTYYLHTTARLLGVEFKDGSVKATMDVPLQSGEDLVAFVDIPCPATIVFFVTNKRMLVFNSALEQSKGLAEIVLYPGEAVEGMLGETIPSPFLTNRRLLNIKPGIPVKWASFEPGAGASAILRKNKKGPFSFFTSPYSLVVTAPGDKSEFPINEERLPIAERVAKLFS